MTFGAVAGGPSYMSSAVRALAMGALSCLALDRIAEYASAM